ncbi:hypothetical protein ZIOFF_004933 [Zingiber officinale]|uniref:Methyltransferase domain-containing protein n=1 Tax=Zingiber officinale TaxID=94328 RepID=A0A8J5HUU5_ZINOF|nr:hypothetical protein ZIOFF_004933 [Zingiber officinale]
MTKKRRHLLRTPSGPSLSLMVLTLTSLAGSGGLQVEASSSHPHLDMPQEQEALADPDYRLDISHFELLVDTWSDVKEASDNMFLRSLVDAIVLQGTGGRLTELEAQLALTDQVPASAHVEIDRLKRAVVDEIVEKCLTHYDLTNQLKSFNRQSSSPVDFAPRTATSYLDPHYWSGRTRGSPPRSTMNGPKTTPIPLGNFTVLEIGCGNSQLCEELRKDGVADMTCVDISPVAVERMRSRFRDKGLEGIKVVQADMLDLSFGSESFDIVIGKGTMVKAEMLFGRIIHFCNLYHNCIFHFLPPCLIVDIHVSLYQHAYCH